MSRDSRLVLSCNKEDTLNIGNSVTKALEKYSRDKLNDFWQNNTDACNLMHFLHNDSYKEHSERYTNGVTVTAHDFDTFWFVFGNGDNMKRSLFMFTTCSSDHEDIEGDYKIVFSIGYWGNADEIMMVVVEAVRQYGDVYYDYNDCDDDGFIKL